MLQSQPMRAPVASRLSSNVQRDAFTEHLDRQPVVAASKHRDDGTVFASTQDRTTMQVGTDDTGVWVRMMVPEPVAKAHLVYGRFLSLSPRFSVLQESHSRPDGFRLHRCVEKGILREVAVVGLGAYAGALAEAC